MKVTLVHNPTAGDGGTCDADALVRLIVRADHEVTYVSSKENGWSKSLQQPADLVAVAGGDGTVGKVARRLLGRDRPFTILPTGTANNTARSLGLTDASHADLIAGWAGGQRMRLDIGVATGPWGERPFIEGFGLGLFAETMARLVTTGTPERERARAAGDEMASSRRLLSERLQRQQPAWLTVLLDGRNLSGEFVLLEAMNTSHVGPNLHLAPDADPGDGLLDLVLLTEDDRGRLEHHLTGGADARPPALAIHRGKFLRVEWDRAAAHIDDMSWSGPFPANDQARADIALDPRGLRFLRPAPTQP